VEGILRVGGRAGDPEEGLGVRLVLREEEFRRVRSLIGVPPAGPEVAMFEADPPGPVGGKLGPARVMAPGPGVAEPCVREDLEFRGLGAAIDGRDPAEDVLLAELGVLDGDVEVSARLEDPLQGVDQLEFGLGPAQAPAHPDQTVVRVGRLGVLVEHLHVGVAGDAVEVVVIFLDVLAVVPLGVGQAEEAFLQEGVPAVPERRGQAEVLESVAEPGQPVLVPAVGPTPGVVVGEGRPGVAVGGIILADRPPGALGNVRPPVLPVGAAAGAVGQSAMFGARFPVTHTPPESKAASANGLPRQTLSHPAGRGEPGRGFGAPTQGEGRRERKRSTQGRIIGVILAGSRARAGGGEQHTKCVATKQSNQAHLITHIKAPPPADPLPLR
jgi:Na+-transporting methylmalonyl-CoA/oxaloacetate decarboxylase gamma subunit